MKKGDFKTEYHKNENFPLSIYLVTVNKNKNLYPHYHDNIEILFVRKGNSSIRVGNNIFNGELNDIFFSNRFQVHSISSDNEEISEIYAIVFDPKIIDELSHNLYYFDLIKPLFSGQLRFPEKISRQSKLYDKLFISLNYIIDEYYNMEKGYELFIKTEIERLFAIVIRYSDTNDEEFRKLLSSPDKIIVEGTWEYINSHYSKKITLNDMAEYLNINKHYYCRLIKKLTGKTFSQLLNMYRIQQAKILVETTNLAISNIIDLAGYTNQSYFNKMYYEYTGSTPVQTRKNI